MTRFGILLFDGAEELDFVGPFEVFAMAREECAGEKPEVLLLSMNGQAVTGAKGMKVGVDAAAPEAPPLDVILVPGGKGTRRVIHEQALVDWVARSAKSCAWVTSVCTGSFVLSAAGLTRGRRITTHWQAQQEFRDLGLTGDLQPGQRWVVDGNLVTSAGVSAGIDMALWLVGQLWSPAFARQVQAAMEYDPAPPYADEAG